MVDYEVMGTDFSPQTSDRQYEVINSLCLFKGVVVTCLLLQVKTQCFFFCQLHDIFLRGKKRQQVMLIKETHRSKLKIRKYGKLYLGLNVGNIVSNEFGCFSIVTQTQLLYT